jgi:hypothetical protein
MQHETQTFGESEAVAASAGLIKGSINGACCIVAIQKRAYCTMTDKEHVAYSITSEDVFDLADDT